MAGKFKTTTNLLHYKPAYNGHNAIEKRVAISLSVKFSTQAPDQSYFFLLPILVRALFVQRSPARAANGQF